MVECKRKGKTEDFVFDISLDGTVVNALGKCVLSNTDGFNFQLPSKSHRATPSFLNYVVPMERGESKEFSEDELLWIKNLENGSLSLAKLKDIIENAFDYDYEVLTGNGYVGRNELNFQEC